MALSISLPFLDYIFMQSSVLSINYYKIKVLTLKNVEAIHPRCKLTHTQGPVKASQERGVVNGTKFFKALSQKTIHGYMGCGGSRLSSQNL